LRSVIKTLLISQSGSEADRFLQPIHGVNLIAFHPPDLKTETIRTQVNSGDLFTGHVTIVIRDSLGS
jgi:hypothetical protein